MLNIPFALQSLVYQTINSHYATKIDAFRYTEDLTEHITQMQNVLDVSLQDWRQGNETFDEGRHSSMVQETEALGFVAEVHGEGKLFDEHMSEGSWVDAASSADVMDEVEWKMAALQQKLDELFSLHVVFRRPTELVPQSSLTVSRYCARTLTGKYELNPAPLSDVLTAMEVVGTLDTIARRFTKQLMACLIAPVITQPGDELHSTLSERDGEITYGRSTHSVLRPMRLDLNADMELTCVLTGPLTVLDSLRQVFMFVNSTIFAVSDDNSSSNTDSVTQFHTFKTLVVELWSPDIIKMLVNDVLRPSLPGSIGQMEEYYDSVGQQYVRFETDMTEKGFLPTDCEDIQTFVRNLRPHFIVQRRANILQMAREILSSDERATVEVSDATEQGGLTMAQKKAGAGEQQQKTKEGLETHDSSSSFKLPTCQVSVQVQSIVDIVYQLLSEATLADKTTAIEVYQHCRDVFDLFRAVAPAAFRHQLSGSPFRVAVFLNDCMYIEHHLMTLGFHFRRAVEQSQFDVVTFADQIPLVRALGVKYFVEMLSQQRDAILHTLSQTGGLANMQDASRYQPAEDAVRRAMSQLWLLESEWKKLQFVLPSERYFKSIGLLVDVLLSELLRQIDDIPHIPTHDTHPLRYILRLCQGVDQFFVKRKLTGRDLVSSRKHNNFALEKVAVSNHVKSYDAFQQTIALLSEESLASAEASHAAGRYSQLGTTKYNELASKRW
ncbi:ribosome biogenesis protein ytm1 [Sorochytrium milnesiophthora]